MKKGTIVLAIFPFTDLNSVKRRPALVISTDNEGKRDVIIAFISSVVTENSLSTDLILNEKDKNFSTTGLHKTSVIKFDKIMTIEKSLLIGEIGSTPIELMYEIDKRIKIVFGL